MDKPSKTNAAKLGVNLPPHDPFMFGEYRGARNPGAAAAASAVPAVPPAMGAAPAPVMPAPAAPAAPIAVPTFTTSPGAAPRTNGVPFVMPPDPIQATTSPGAAPPRPAAPFSGDPLFPSAQRVAPPNTREAPPKPITGGPTIPGTAPAAAAPAPVAAPKPAAPPPAPLYNAARGVGATVRTLGPSVVTAGLGALLGNQTADIGNPALQPDGAMPINPAMAQIPTGGVPGAGPTPATQPYNAFTDTETGRNLSNIASAAGALPGLAVGARTAKALSTAAGFGVGSKATIQPTAPAAAPVAAAPAAAPAQPYPETAGNRQMAAPVSPAAVAQAVANPTNPNGAVTRIGNSYSGAPGISGDITINGKTPGGGFVANAGTGAPARLGVNPSIDMALSEARDAAMARGDYDAVRRSYGGDFGADKVDPVQALMNNGRRMTTKKAAAIAALQAGAGAAESARATQQATARRATTEADGMAMDNKAKARLGVLQDALFNAKTPQEQAAAEEKLRAFQGKYEKAPAPVRAFAVPGGQAISADGVAYTTPSRVYDPDTKTFIEPPAASANTPLPPKDQLVKGQQYNTPRGPAVWDGSKFVSR